MLHEQGQIFQNALTCRERQEEEAAEEYEEFDPIDKLQQLGINNGNSCKGSADAELSFLMLNMCQDAKILLSRGSQESQGWWCTYLPSFADANQESEEGMHLVCSCLR